MNDAYLAAGMLTVAAGLIIGAAWRKGFVKDILTRIGIALVILSIAFLAYDVGKGLSSIENAFGTGSSDTTVAPSAPPDSTYSDSDSDGVADELDADPLDPTVQ